MKHQIGDRIKFYNSFNQIEEARIVAIGSIGQGFTESSITLYELDNGIYIYETGIINSGNI